MELIVWESYYDREYLIYQFNADGTPDPKCRVHQRQQGCPQMHMLTLVKDGKEILSKVKGKCLETGLYQLPCQRYNTPVIMGRDEMTAKKPSKLLPKTLHVQYDNVLVTWELNPSFVVMRDYGPQGKTVYVYAPIQIQIL
jgi:hypothetical protein